MFWCVCAARRRLTNNQRLWKQFLNDCYYLPAGVQVWIEQTGPAAPPEPQLRGWFVPPPTPGVEATGLVKEILDPDAGFLV